MLSAVLTMILVLLVAAALGTIVAVGLGGQGRWVSDGFTVRMEELADHLNGDAEPPARFQQLVDHAVNR